MHERKERERPRRAEPEVDYFAAAFEEALREGPEVLDAYRRRLNRTLEGLSPEERAEFFARREKRERRTDAVMRNAPRVAAASAAAAAGISFLVQLLGDPRNRLIAAVTVVVMLGAAGLVLRGAGELRTSKVLKASGYFCGAVAYMVTAGVTLLNVAQLLQL